MEVIAVLRLLSQRWKLVAAGAIAAFAIGLSAAGVLPGPTLVSETRSGLAQSKVLIDTRSSYATDLEGGAEALGAQAALLATLIADEPQRVAIAREAGVPLDQLDVLVGGITEPKTLSTLARKLSEVVEHPRRPFAVTVSADNAVSIITIDTAAPTPAAAAELARATRSALEAVTASSAPSESRALVVEQLGGVRSLEFVDSGPSAPVVVIAVTIAFFVCWCFGLVIVTGVAHAWRAAAPAAATAG